MTQEHHWEMVLCGDPTPDDLCYIIVNFPLLRRQASQQLSPFALQKSYYRRILLEHGDHKVKEEIANDLLSSHHYNDPRFGWIVCDIIRYVGSFRAQALSYLITLPHYTAYIPLLIASIPDVEYQIAELLSEKLPDYTSLPDETLLSERNDKFFAELVDRYHDKLFRAAYKILQNEDAARDALQEAWIKIYQHANLFHKKENINASSWLYKVTINTAITHYRKQRDHIIDPDEVVRFSQKQDSLLSSLDGDEYVTHQVIQKVLQAMSADESKLLTDFYIFGLSCQELADILGITAATVKMRLFRARAHFREIWLLIEDKK